MRKNIILQLKKIQNNDFALKNIINFRGEKGVLMNEIPIIEK